MPRTIVRPTPGTPREPSGLTKLLWRMTGFRPMDPKDMGPGPPHLTEEQKKRYRELDCRG